MPRNWGLCLLDDTALLLAKAKGRTEHVLVFDDHVDPNAYWLVFVALTE